MSPARLVRSPATAVRAATPRAAPISLPGILSSAGRPGAAGGGAAAGGPGGAAGGGSDLVAGHHQPRGEAGAVGRHVAHRGDGDGDEHRAPAGRDGPGKGPPGGRAGGGGGGEG